MSSFIDLMANDIWSKENIDNKVHNLIRSKYSIEDEMKASRLSRKTNPSEEDLLFVSNIDIWISECVEIGRQARQDMELLLKIMEVEGAEKRLQQSEILPEYDEQELILNQEQIDIDQYERQIAQSIIDQSTSDIMFWVEKRRPVIDEENINLNLNELISPEEQLSNEDDQEII